MQIQQLTDIEIEESTCGRLKRLNHNGYVLILIPEKDEWVKEHRYLVEKKIGRLLKPEETIHHINGEQGDNRIENLMPFHSQREHKNFENKVKQFGMTHSVLKQINERWENF